MTKPPEFYSEELFEEWLQMRIQAKHVKTNTPVSISRARNKLQRWGEKGYNCDAIIEHAIEKQWRGLYLPHGFEPRKNHKAHASFRPAIEGILRNSEIPPERTPEERQQHADRQRAIAREALSLMRERLK